MSNICLFADDGRTAEYLIHHVVRGDKKKYIGVALYPEALQSFEKWGIRCILLSNYIEREEERERGIEASRFIFQMNRKLGLDNSNNNSFNFGEFDLLYSYHFVNYFILASIFLHINNIKKVLREMRPKRVYLVDLRMNVTTPVDPRPRSLWVKTLHIVCETERVPVSFVKGENISNKDTICELPARSYGYRNNPFPLRLGTVLRSVLEGGLCHPSVLRAASKYWKVRGKEGHGRTDSRRAILYVGSKGRFDRVIKRFRETLVTNICLDYGDSEDGYFYIKSNVVLTNYKYMVDTYIDDNSEKLIETYAFKIKMIFDELIKKNEVKNRLRFRGICFYEIFMEYLKVYVDVCFLENLKIYLATKRLVQEFNVRFGLADCGWTLPKTYSIHEALKSHGVWTAYYSHGLNIVNNEVAESIIGDGTLMPCKILFSPGPEFLKKYVEGGLKDKENNYITGFPYYKKGKRIESSGMKYIVKRLLGLNPRKKVVLYPGIYRSPSEGRPNQISFAGEYNFVKRTIKAFRKYMEFQFVVKAKVLAMPDRCFLNLFNDNYPNAVLRYGELRYYLSIADVMIFFSSSCGFDALLAGIPVLYFKPYVYYDWFEPYASKNNEPNYFLEAKSYEDIPRQCRRIVSGEFPEWYKEKMRTVDRTFMTYTGAAAAKQVARVIRKFM